MPTKFQKSLEIFSLLLHHQYVPKPANAFRPNACGLLQGCGITKTKSSNPMVYMQQTNRVIIPAPHINEKWPGGGQSTGRSPLDRNRKSESLGHFLTVGKKSKIKNGSLHRKPTWTIHLRSFLTPNCLLVDIYQLFKERIVSRLQSRLLALAYVTKEVPEVTGEA